MIAFKAGIIIFAVREALEFGEAVHESDDMAKIGAILIRIFISYSQVFALIIGIPATWPELLDAILQTSGKFTSASDKIFVADCFYHML